MEPNTVLSSKTQALSETSFISRVFLWMSCGLMVSAAGAVWLLSQPGLMKALFSNQWMFLGLVLLQFGLVIWLSRGIMSMSALTATTTFMVYSFLNGLTMSSIFVIYTGGSIAMTFAVTAGTFFFFSLYGLTTKRDLTNIGSLAVMLLIGIIIASVVNIFLKSTALMWITTYLGIAVFLGLIAYDTQKLKAMHAAGFQNAEMEKKIAIIGALALYLDFVNLFILLLRIFGKQRD